MDNVPRITRRDLLNWLGTNNDMSLSESLTELILEVVNDDYELDMLKKDIFLYKGAL